MNPFLVMELNLFVRLQFAYIMQSLNNLVYLHTTRSLLYMEKQIEQSMQFLHNKDYENKSEGRA